VDAFYVRDAVGGRIGDAERLAAIKATLAERIRGSVE
jgi:hypothetical protein